MNHWQKMVRKRHRKIGDQAPSSVTMLSPLLSRFYSIELRETAQEASRVVRDGCPHEVAGGLADLTRVIMQVAVSMGIDLDTHFRAVCKSFETEDGKRADHLGIMLRTFDREERTKQRVWLWASLGLILISGATMAYVLLRGI